MSSPGEFAAYVSIVVLQSARTRQFRCMFLFWIEKWSRKSSAYLDSLVFCHLKHDNGNYLYCMGTFKMVFSILDSILDLRCYSRQTKAGSMKQLNIYMKDLNTSYTNWPSKQNLSTRMQLLRINSTLANFYISPTSNVWTASSHLRKC